MIQLRDYQERAIRRVQWDWEHGALSVMGTAATGAGKTAIYLALLVRELEAHPERRALILAHRKELIEQPIDRLYQFWPSWYGRAGIVMAQRDEIGYTITVATVQTLAVEHRLERLLANGPIDYLITDECHHAPSDSYLRVYQALREANPHLKHLGVTATPIRADGQGLRAVYEKESFHEGIKEMVQAGWLVPPRWLAVQTGISLAGVSVHDGDYSAKSLASVYETQNCFDLVVASHQKYAGGRQCLAFVETVAGAHRLAATFRKAGVSAAAADGTTPKAERAKILADFRTGKTQVLCNVAIYTEGLDLPNVSCIHQVRPTKSDGLYVQIIGRALRPAPGKEDALILDYAPLEVRNICMLGDVLGIDVRKDVYLQDDATPGEVVGGFTYDGKVRWLRGDPMELISHQLNYLELSPYSWHRGEDGYMSLGLGEGEDGCERTVVISALGPDGTCTLWLVAQRRAEKHATAHQVMVAGWDEVSDAAEAIISRRLNATLIARDRRWRKEAPTDRQIEFGRRLRVYEDGMTKGQLAEAITHKLAVNVIRRGVHIHVPERPVRIPGPLR